MYNGYLEIMKLNTEAVHFMLKVEESIAKFIDALKSEDYKQMEHIIANDESINVERDEIEMRCLQLIMRQHPYARDLRTVLAVFKFTTDVERIGDHVRDICENLIDKNIKNSEQVLDNIIKMAENVREMFNMGIKCFANFDDEICKDVIAYDDKVDGLYRSINQDIVSGIKSDGNYELLSLISVIKHLEKMGDHSVNIAEWVHFIITGDRK